MNRRTFLQLAAAGAFAVTSDWLHLAGSSAGALAATTAGSHDDTLRFIVFGDHGSGNKVQREDAAGMAAYAAARKAAGQAVAFALVVGDNFYDSGVQSVSDPQWETKFEKMYDPEQLNFPFYAVLGNHDWKGKPSAQIAYAASNPGTRWRMDNFYYRRTMGGSAERPLAEFFFIDTNLWFPGNQSLPIGNQQLIWLEAGLKASKARWRFIVCHHPPFPDGDHALEKETTIVRETLTPIYTKYAVDAVFSGHDHDLQRAEIPGIKSLFLVSGSGGATLRGRLIEKYAQFYHGPQAGFLAIQLDKNTLRGQFQDPHGNIFDSWERKPITVMA